MTKMEEIYEFLNIADHYKNAQISLTSPISNCNFNFNPKGYTNPKCWSICPCPHWFQLNHILWHIFHGFLLFSFF